MQTMQFNLLKEKTEYNFMPTLTAYLIDGNPEHNEQRPAVLVIPGGGYDHVSFREGERIALFYNTAGFHSFILNYRVAPHTHPCPILDAAKAIEFIRDNASAWNIAINKIAVCGFSAGGHLAASISTLWNDAELFSNNEKKNELHKPNATILSYPVITGGEFAHKGSFKNLTGNETKNELWEKMSLEKRVDKNTPPAFIWHTIGDEVVPVENSLLYAGALRQSNIPFELHVYPDGSHGMSCVSDETYWRLPKFSRKYPWLEQSVEWLYLQFGIMNIQLKQQADTTSS